MRKQKIFNDPVYGLISVPDGLIMELIEDPAFQRLRRINQLGLSHLVYPGATHSRFHHALGAFSLMTNALDTLRHKSVEISDEEYQASQIAILLHDIGHGPFSHVLEHSLLKVSHEEVTLYLMHHLNEKHHGSLELAIQIFTDQYPRKFFNELISGQLDLDRLDYLTRDSFYTGVAEGVIGYDRMIKMMDVVDESLVLEEKAIYSIEKFLVARRLMYWQVYLHKTNIAAEAMLRGLLELIKVHGEVGNHQENLSYIIDYQFNSNYSDLNQEFVDRFLALDDTDIWQLLKQAQNSPYRLCSYLANGLLNRKLLKIQFSNQPINRDFLDEERLKLEKQWKIDKNEAKLLIKEGSLDLTVYSHLEREINIKTKENRLRTLSDVVDLHSFLKTETKYFHTYPNKLC